VRLRNSSRWCTSASLHAGHGHTRPASEARAVTVRSGDVPPGTTSTSMQGERLDRSLWASDFRAGTPRSRRKKVAGVPKIIPGDWGKVESGWLAQPL